METTKTATAKDVHNEFDIVSQQLLREATKNVGNSNKKKNSLTTKMKELGFGNSISIKDDAIALKNAQTTLSLNIQYPQNNFFTEDAVGKICKKYGLLMASPGDFIGEIPEKNQMEIANFKLAESEQKVKIIDKKKFYENIGEIQRIRSKKDSGSSTIYFFHSFINQILVGNLISKYKRTISKKQFLSLNDPNLSFRCDVKPEFMIVATQDNFNMANKEIVSEYMLVDKDPVVLCRVDGGYLQVSAWGAETEMAEFKTATKN